ncbi:hypothetical protein RB200_27515 [Streptomyces sp. PmtG]
MTYETAGDLAVSDATGGGAPPSGDRAPERGAVDESTVKAVAEPKGTSTGEPTDNASSEAELTRDRVLAICRSNWEYRGIDDASTRDMLDELSGHLDEAAAAGRTARDVVGPDVKEFAAAWARARTPLPLRVLRMAALIPFVLGSLLLLTHLIDRTLTLSVEPDRIAFHVALAAGVVAWEMRRGNLGFRGWLLGGLAALPVAALTVWLIGDDPLFHLPIWGTLLFLIPGLPYAVQDLRARRAERAQGESSEG